MYELSVRREFNASHAIVMQGELEESHRHDWRVALFVKGESLDQDGLVCDFHAVQKALDAVIAPFVDGDFNVTPPFDQINPSAELIAEHIAQAVQAKLVNLARVDRVTITEAPGCQATYFLPMA